MKPRLLALLLLAAWLNLWGVGWGAPDPAYSQTALANRGSHPQALVHPDAFHFAERSFYMAATGDWNPHFFENPSLYINLNLLLHLLSGAAADQPVAPEGAYVMREFAPFPPYVMGRVVSALAGVLFVAFTYALGRRLFGARAGELGALLAALSPVVVQHSHYATTNVTAAALATGALWASVRLLRERAPAATTAYLAAGLLVGLAGSAKYNAGLAGVVYVLVGLIGVRRSYVETGQSLALRAWRPFLLGLAAVGAGFLLARPTRCSTRAPSFRMSSTSPPSTWAGRVTRSPTMPSPSTWRTSPGLGWASRASCSRGLGWLPRCGRGDR